MKFNSRVADGDSALAELDTQTDSLKQLSTKSDFVTHQYTKIPQIQDYYVENDSIAVFSGVQNDLQQSFAEGKPIAPQEPILLSTGNNPDAIVPLSGDNQIDALLIGHSWDNPSTITYSFMSDSGASSYYGTETVSALSSEVSNNVRTILETILEPLINVNFVEVADSASNYGQIRYMFSNGPGYAYAYYPSTSNGLSAGDVHLSPSDDFSEGPGNYSYMALIHETGHALGLKHPGNYNAGGGGTPGPYLPFSEDNDSNTLMTYNFLGNRPATAMPFDIKALQYIYGAKVHHAADTSYSFSSVYGYTANGESWGSSTTPMKLAIWDSGGRDTLDFSALSFDASGYHFDLQQGGINTSQTAYNGTSYNAAGDTSGNTYLTSTNGTAIAYNTTIENAIGSSSSDDIIGNGANNTLNGGIGNDTLVGGVDDNSGNDNLYGGNGNDQLYSKNVLVGSVYQGADRLYGGNGNDSINGGYGANNTLEGGSGNDVYTVFTTAADTIVETANNGTDTVQSRAGSTLGSNLENLTLIGTSAINGTGNSLNNTLTGNGANNTLNGGIGNDTLVGGVDDNSGNDNLYGGDGNDQLYSKNVLVGSVYQGADRLYGGNGNDSINGGYGANNTLEGGSGNDVYTVFTTAADTIVETANNGTDTVQSRASYTLGSNLENLTLIGTSAINGTGNSLNNTLTGNAANNTLNGGGGVDTLTGGSGNDVLTGGAGNDSLSGGSNSDKFLYNTNASFTSAAVGIDVITDFVRGSDKIVLDKTTFQAITSAAGTGFSLAREFAIVSSSTAAATSSADIVYNSVNGNLFYNQNGASAGFGTGAQFATLFGTPTILATDFSIQA